MYLSFEFHIKNSTAFISTRQLEFELHVSVTSKGLPKTRKTGLERVAEITAIYQLDVGILRTLIEVRKNVLSLHGLHGLHSLHGLRFKVTAFTSSETAIIFSGH